METAEPRIEYPIFYLAGEVNQEELNRKSARFRRKNNELFKKIAVNLGDTLSLLKNGISNDEKDLS